MIPSLVAAAAGGLLLALSFPPADFSMLAWVAFIPLFWAIELVRGSWKAGVCGLVFGIAFFGLDVNWIYRTLILHGHFSAVMAATVFVAMVLSLALIPGVFGLVMALLKERLQAAAIGAPFVWVALEYIRTWIFTGFPWDLTGYSQAGFLHVAQIADISGVYGISFVVVLVNAGLWALLQAWFAGARRPWKFASIAALVFLLGVGYGYVRLGQFSRDDYRSGDFKAAVLQGNIPQDLKWEESAKDYTFRTYEYLGAQAVKDGAKLLIWPETAAPVLFGMFNPEWQRVGTMASQLGKPMLVGAPSVKKVNGNLAYYNSAFLMEGNMLRYRYDKIHLVPFGEYMPLSWLLPLGPGLAAREADYSPGREMTVMQVEGGPPFSVLICYEAIFPELARLAVNQGAKLLVNITNDGWFGHTGAPYQHLIMTGMRSIENRVWLLRAANTGVSAAFDPTGRMVKHLPLEQQGFLIEAVPTAPPVGSFYTAYGDVFAWACLAVSAALGIAAMRTSRMSRFPG
jgi:apolipoprotein N-acyltransferase